ncbi:MAG: hypothetical protein KF819_33655 [Labilithrix sp.]|nr:hypothetical protein [Labilithrix sp.]
MRDSIIPESFSPESSVVVLPFGETTGTPPPGREAECAPHATVPLAYALTARFEEEDNDVLFETPAPSARAREIGLIGNRLYWLFDDDRGNSGIATGLVSQPGSASVLVPATQTILQFDVGRYVVYTTSPPAPSPPAAALMVIRETEAPRQLISLNCLGVASAESRVYCRWQPAGWTTTLLYSWDVNAAAPSSGLRNEYELPIGGVIAVTASPAALYSVSDTGALGTASILRASLPGTGGFPQAPMIVASNQSRPRGLAIGRSFVSWVDHPEGRSIVRSTLANAASGARVFELVSDGAHLSAPDTDDQTLWASLRTGAGPGPAFSVVRVDALPSGQGHSVYRNGRVGVGGLVAGATHVYWTQSDGRVYRARKR